MAQSPLAKDTRLHAERVFLMALSAIGVAEKAAWEFAAAHPDLHLAVVNPSGNRDTIT